MSGNRRLEVAEITKSGAKGKALVSALGKMDSVTPPSTPTKKVEVKKKK